LWGKTHHRLKDSKVSRNDNGQTGDLSLTQHRSLSDWARTYLGSRLTPLARWLDRIGISPNAVTITGVLLSLGAGIVLALGYWKAGAALIVASGIMDGMDGLLARYAQKTTRFGAFLDSVLDRWSDSAFFIGILAWYAKESMPTLAILSSAALATSMLVSYTRARAEGIGAECKRGVFTRMERLIAILAGLLLDQMHAALWVIAVLSAFTALQRIYFTHKYVMSEPDHETRP
jgi:CDP-diacylglycerol--glycerol-3-phosphate 3-phosphatidyltransferase